MKNKLSPIQIKLVDDFINDCVHPIRKHLVNKSTNLFQKNFILNLLKNCVTLSTDSFLEQVCPCYDPRPTEIEYKEDAVSYFLKTYDYSRSSSEYKFFARNEEALLNFSVIESLLNINLVVSNHDGEEVEEHYLIKSLCEQKLNMPKEIDTEKWPEWRAEQKKSIQAYIKQDMLAWIEGELTRLKTKSTEKDGLTFL